jgi:hypothetical protein
VNAALVHAYGQVKLAGARTNHELGYLDDHQARAIRSRERTTCSQQRTSGEPPGIIAGRPKMARNGVKNGVCALCGRPARCMARGTWPQEAAAMPAAVAAGGLVQVPLGQFTRGTPNRFPERGSGKDLVLRPVVGFDARGEGAVVGGGGASARVLSALPFDRVSLREYAVAPTGRSGQPPDHAQEADQGGTG